MRKSKHFIAFIIVLAVLGLSIGFVLPRLVSVNENAEKETISEEVAIDTTAQVEPDPIVEDTVSFETKLKNELQIIQEKRDRAKTKWIWTLGRGQTIIVYLLQAKRFIEKQGGQVLFMEELHERNALQSARLNLLTPKGDSLKLELQVSENIFRSNASLLAVAFQVNQLTPELITELNKIDFPYDLLVPPFGLSETFYPDLDRVKNKELILWLTMESSQLNRSHNKYRPLRIHHTENQIETIIDDAKKLMPNAAGIATRFGEQAVEHKQLLQAILRPADKNKLWFLDISENKQSKLAEACRDMSIKCKMATPYNPDHSSLEDYIKLKMREASKSGLATMILPLTEQTLSLVADIRLRAEKQGTTLINLSTFISY